MSFKVGWASRVSGKITLAKEEENCFYEFLTKKHALLPRLVSSNKRIMMY